MLTQGTTLAVKAPFEFINPATGRTIRGKQGQAFIVTGNGQTHSGSCPVDCAIIDKSNGARIGSGYVFAESMIDEWFEVEL